MSCSSDSNLIVAAINNFKIFQGDTFDIDLTFTNSDGTPISLLACTLKFTIIKGSTVELILTESDGMSISGADHNVIQINKQMTLPASVYKYSLEVTFPSTQVITYLYGSFTVVDIKY